MTKTKRRLPDGAEGAADAAGGQAHELTAAELAHWTELYARPAAAETDPGEPFLLFRLGEERFAVPMADLDEVASLAGGTALPHVGPLVQGLANLRGEILLLLDAGALLSAGARPRLGVENRTLVIRDRHGRRAGLMVDAIEGVESLDPSTFRLPSRDAGSESPVRRAGAGEHKGAALIRVDVGPLREAAFSGF